MVQEGMVDNNKVKLLILWDILCKNADENHAMNADEIREELAKRGISVIRRAVADDIAALNKYGYEVLSYKKKYYYYYVVNRLLRCQSSARYGRSGTACRRVKIVKTVREAKERAYRKTFGTIMFVSGRKRVETPCIGC